MVYSVSNYLDKLNIVLEGEKAKIKGEISRIEKREKTIYFDLKDSDGEPAVLNCLIFRSVYKMMGIEFQEGMEVIIGGEPNIWKPIGRLSIKVESVELVGEGVLQKAYEFLKKKLEKEGLFAPERKKKIPVFPTKIGLISSRYGEAIHDFNANLENIGFKIKFFDSRVEGQEAVPDLIKAIDWFNKKSDCEVLVVIRGGGSWESLQAFNNEAVVRAIAGSKIPVLCGIGHERDIPLATLAADKSVSTPTAAAQFISHSWRETKQYIYNLQAKLLNSFEELLFYQESKLTQNSEEIKNQFSSIYHKFPLLIEGFKRIFSIIGQTINNQKENLAKSTKTLKEKFTMAIDTANQQIKNCEEKIKIQDPKKQLRLGYSLVFDGEKIIKDAAQLSVGQLIKLQFYKGSADSQIKKIKK
ncbi:MAG: Exodeoxyribonuclease 7 large subunit [Parcubacteria group bacterium ADurb.Bin159]|jgi:exodeoxyribonuclease VII large subunit|nr:MAG: Exodeoxyribonuclease 7 large subunit [Parcubacteria group bacterium ADurb.Bin159]